MQRKAAGFVFQGYRKESNVTNLKILKDLQLDMLELWREVRKLKLIYSIVNEKIYLSPKSASVKAWNQIHLNQSKPEFRLTFNHLFHL